MPDKLDAQRALIFRIVHRDNLRWILDNGIHCGNSANRDPSYVSIGNPDLISHRKAKPIPIQPGGTLSDYVPFYFTPYSPMLLNIKSGRNGITRRSNEEIVIVVSSLHRLKALNVSFVFSDRHAYASTACFYSDLSDLNQVDWTILRNRDFRRDVNDPGKVERYQAEALVYQCCPIAAILGIGCFTGAVKQSLDLLANERNVIVKTTVQSGWYFS